jgi:hypothetical protein
MGEGGEMHIGKVVEEEDRQRRSNIFIIGALHLETR